MKATGKLPDPFEIAVGMKVMILVNLSTEAEIANGTRGTVRDIILDPREEPLKILEDNLNMVNLQYPPAMILFEPEGGSRISSAFTDPRSTHPIAMPKGQIPITPLTKSFSVVLKDGSKVMIVRKQYALTGGYTFTDIKSQGQTMGAVVIDIRDTPTGKISPFKRSQLTLYFHAVAEEIVPSVF